MIEYMTRTIPKGKSFTESPSWGTRRSKYVISYHDGVKTHKDGSPFFDVATFPNKPARDQFVRGLRQQGYRETP